MDLFHDNEIMEDLSLTNIELLAYLKLPKYYNAALDTLLDLTPGMDDFESYKAPYLASVCMWILPESSMKVLFADYSQFDRVFNCIFSKDISAFRQGLFFNMFEQLISIVPEELYQYLSTNSDHLLASFASNFDKISIVNIFRILLDTPITSTLSDGSILEGPWWHDSNHLLSLLISSLASPDCAPNIELLFYTILTRGLPLEPVKIHTCDFVLPPLLSSSSLRSLLRTALSSPSEDVAYAAFRVLTRIFWDSMKEAEAGMGGHEASNKKTHAVLMSAWETERNALKNVLSDSEIQRVSPAVKEFLPELHAFIDSKRSGDNPKCPKSILGLGQFLRYYLIRCSPEEFDSAVQAHLLDDLLSLFPRFSACSLLHYHLSQLLRKVLKQDAKQRALLFSTGFLSFVEQHVDDTQPYRGPLRRVVRSLAKAKTGLLRQLRALLHPDWLLPEMLSGSSAVPTVMVQPVSAELPTEKKEEEEENDEIEVVKVPDFGVGNEVEMVDLPEFPAIPGITSIVPPVPELVGPIDPNDGMGVMGHMDGFDPNGEMGRGTKKGSLADSLQLKLEAMEGRVDEDEVFGLEDSFKRFQNALDKKEEEEKDDRNEFEKKEDFNNASDSSDSDLDLNAIPL
ncbi:uncharacterized protein [Blastocystis hominis]|uniref:Uncharacterized protein n=1 Tax=Blastocystis hominis TaxID=12968 RepID=D8LVS7_BLAHO|nr:uncharacterized protein [Blastocystis hominis]CBK19916.2 unnamed protein product [Blastocystis hominis]|eukprot:XP_012893964.1 uncharacterized protein [Blastocystis hominis]